MNVESLLMGLTAKGVTWDPHRVVGCFNSANLRGLEHAALLRGLTGPALAWAYWQYLGDNSQITPIIQALSTEAAKYSHGINGATPEGFAQAALAEHLRPLCHRCSGRGHMPMGGICPRCKGEGGKQLSRSAIARLIGAKSWKPAYAGTLSILLGEISAWEHDISQTVKQNLKQEQP